MAPKHIGRYQVKAELDRGGMAVVYLARDPRFERDVAIKMLPHEVRDQPTVRKRFEREAKVIAGLEHPSIVPVYDFGEDDRQPYLVMRYMTGGSLADRLHQRLGLRDAAGIVTRVASALDEAHGRGVVHRDLKPGNILFDSHGEAFLSDFGIVKMPEGSATAAISNSLVLGTPAYMSPEQAMGKELDRRTDIYALGAVLYEVLTGMPPYLGPTPMSIAMKHVVEPVPTVKPARPDLPDEVEDIISTAMAKNPDLRYETAGDMAIALNRIVQKYPLESAGVPNMRSTPPDPNGAVLLIDTEEFELPQKIDVVISNESARKGTSLPAMPGRHQLMTAMPLLIGLVVTVGLVALGVSASIARLQAATVTPTFRPKIQIAPSTTTRPVPTSPAFIAMTAEPQAEVTATPEPTEQVAPATVSDVPATRVIVIMKAIEDRSDIPEISLRAGPGINYRFIRGITAGTRIQVVARAASSTGDGLAWYRVLLNDGDRGWVFSGSVQRVSGDVLSLPFDDDFPPTPETTLGPRTTTQATIPPPTAVVAAPTATAQNTTTPTPTPTPSATARTFTATPSVTSTSTATAILTATATSITPTSSPSPTATDGVQATITPVPFTTNGEITQ